MAGSREQIGGRDKAWRHAATHQKVELLVPLGVRLLGRERHHEAPTHELCSGLGVDEMVVHAGERPRSWSACRRGSPCCGRRQVTVARGLGIHEDWSIAH